MTSEEMSILVINYCKENKIKPASLARTAGISRSTIYNVIKKKSKKINTIIEQKILMEITKNKKM